MAAIIVSIISVMISLSTFLINYYHNKKLESYKILCELNSMVFNNQDVIVVDKNKVLTMMQAAYAAVVWNFIEFVYSMKLNKDTYLKPAINQFVDRYGSWYKNHKSSFGEKFQRKISRDFGI